MASEFEQMFSSLAYAFLQQTGLDLSKYLIGFEVADVNENKTKALGFFALKIKDDYYYVPVFFVGGEIKPLTMMWNTKEDLFMPLDQEWIDFIEKESLPQIGESSPQPKPPAMPMNIRDFLRPPFINKLASKLNEDLGMEGLPSFLKRADDHVKLAFWKALRDTEQLTRTIVNGYSWDTIKDACYSPVLTKQAKDAKDAREPVKLIEDQADACSLNATDKVKFLKQGYVIADDRQPKDVQNTYEIDYSGTFESPDETGIYNIFTNKGKKDCLICIAPYDFEVDRQSKRNMVIDITSGDYAYDVPINEMVFYKEDGSPYKRIKTESMTPVSSLRMNQEYILFDTSEKRGKTGCTSLPFIVTQKSTGEDGNVYYTCEMTTKCGCMFTLIVKESGRMSKLGTNLIVPKSFKAIKIGKNNLRLISRPELVHHVFDNHYEYKLASLGLFRNDELVDKFATVKEAEFKLVADYGFSIEDAERCTKNGESLWTKKAFLPQVGSPGYASSLIGDSAPGGVKEIEYNIYNARPTAYRSGLVNAHEDNRKIQDEINRAIELSDSGMKDVFDKAMVGILSKISDVDSELMSYIPDFVKAVDKLGRYLFMLWYRSGKIKDKFGVNEYKETEDMVKDHFTGLGKIILELKKKYSPELV